MNRGFLSGILRRFWIGMVLMRLMMKMIRFEMGIWGNSWMEIRVRVRV